MAVQASGDAHVLQSRREQTLCAMDLASNLKEVSQQNFNWIAQNRVTTY
jgi:hypothetical protein